MNDESYKENYSQIFGDKAIVRGSWVFDKQQNKFVSKDEYHKSDPCNDNHHILKPIDTFVSPIDGSVISCRSKLRQHNEQHGVTNVADYGDGYFERRGKEKHADSIGATKEAKRERIKALQKSMHQHGIY